MSLVDALGTTEALADVFSDAAILASMIRFEVALARAEAEAGVIPAGAAAAIVAAARPEAFDGAAIVRAARRSGTIIIPFVDTLTGLVSKVDSSAASFVHRGATSQDVSDTVLVLCLRRAGAIMQADSDRLVNSLRALSDRHAATVMLARTLLQPAPPTTFGLTSAGWFGAVSRSRGRLAHALDEACVLQFGGASGTLAALGSQGLAVARGLARELDLPLPDAPWHAHRDRLASLVTACGIYAGTLGKIARDTSLLMQHEIGEAAEPGGGSSTMPQKRNPAGSAIALAAATRVPGLVSSFLSGMPQELERGVGGWHAEMATVASVVQTTGASLAAVADLIDGLQVNPDRMRQNLEATRGVVFAEQAMMLLAPVLGRDAARERIAAALDASARGGKSFTAALAEDAEVAAALTPADRSGLGTPEAYLGVAGQWRRRLLGHETE